MSTRRYVIGETIGEPIFFRSSIVERPRPLPSPVTTPHWYAAAVPERQEQDAAKRLEGLGYLTYLPIVSFWQRVPRHRLSPSGPRKKMVNRPLFPGYIFVAKNPEHSFEPARKTKGVTAILATEGEYTRIPAKAMAVIMGVAIKETDKAAARFLNLLGKAFTVPDNHLFAGFAAVVRKASITGAICEIATGAARITVSLPVEEVEAL